MKKCWNCNDPIPGDSNKDICSACGRRMAEEDDRESCHDDRNIAEDSND